MKIETQLVHDNGQYICEGEPCYHGAQLMGYFKGIHDDDRLVLSSTMKRRPSGAVQSLIVGRCPCSA